MILSFLHIHILNLLGIICFSFSFFLLFWTWQRRSLYTFSLKVPTYWGIPIFGVLLQIGHVNNFLTKTENFFKEKSCNSVCVWIGLHPVLLTRDVELINTVLSKPEFLEKAKIVYKPFIKFFGDTLAVSSVHKWRHTRALFEPQFKRQTLLDFFPIFNHARKYGLAKLELIADGQPHELLKLIHPIIMGISMETTLGFKITEEYIPLKFTEDFLAMSKVIMVQIFACLLNSEFLAFSYGKKKIKSLYNFAENVVKQSVKDIYGSTDINENSNLFVTRLTQLFISKEISWQNLIDESISLIAASFETIANTIHSSLILLAMHPDIQAKLYSELQTNIPDPNSNIDNEILCNLSYLDLVVKEVLRLMPPAPFVGRNVTNDTYVQGWPVKFPKNLQILISVYHLHRRIDIWGADAVDFKPERFLSTNLTTLQRNAYIPFLKGPRNCIGWRYAQFTIKVLLASFIRNYEFKTNAKFKELKVVSHITLKHLNEPTFIITKRF